MKRATAAARDKIVVVMGGAQTAQQFLREGLVDEVSVHLVPVLLGSGTRLFDQIGGTHVHLEPTSVLETPAAIHLQFRVPKKASGVPPKN